MVVGLVLFGQVAAAAELLPGDAVPPEVRDLLRSPDPVRRRQGVEQLEGLDPPATAAPLVQLLADADAGVRSRAAQALGRRQVLDAAEALIERLSDSEGSVRAASAEALGQLGALPPGLSGRAAVSLARALGDAQFDVRLAVLLAISHLLSTGALGTAELPALLGPLLLRFEDDHVGVRRAAVAVLGRLAELRGPDGRPVAELAARAVVPLLGRLSDSARDVRSEALGSLAALGAKQAAPAAMRLLRDPAPEVQQKAALCLGQLQSVEAAPALTELLLQAVGPQAEAVRLAAARALGQIARAHAQTEAGRTALRTLIGALGRDELRLPAREALLEVGPAALASIIERLGAARGMVQANDRPALPPSLSEMGALVGLLRDLGASAPPPLRARAAAALAAELSSGRVPREEVVAALGRLGDPSSAPLVAGLLSDPDVELRRRAVVALRQPGLLDARALDALEAATRDADSLVRRGAIEALGELRLPAALPRLGELLWQGDVDTQIAAAEALATIGAALPPGTATDTRVVRALEEAVTSARPGEAERRMRRAAAAALGLLLSRSAEQQARVLPGMLAFLRRSRVTDEGPLPEVVAAVGAALRGRRNDLAREVLLDLATAGAAPHTPDAALALDALDALCALRDPQATGRLARLLDHRDALRRLRAAAALGCLLPTTEAALQPLLGLLVAEPDPRVRAEAAWALSRLPPSSARVRRVVTGLRAALTRNRSERGDAGERANLTAALVLLRSGEPADADLLYDPEPAVRANAALLLAGPAMHSPGLRARLRALAASDWDHRVRRAAERALAGQGPAGARTHFLGLYHLDYDRRPLPEVRYRLSLPDGLMRIGTTDGRGTAREELLPAGACEVEVIDEGLKPL